MARRFIVHHEQGFGDTIQFVRFLPWLKARGRLSEPRRPGRHHSIRQRPPDPSQTDPRA